MLGSSRESLTTLLNSVAGRSGDEGFAQAAGDLLSVASVISGDKALRTALVDGGQSVDSRAALVRDLFGARINAVATDILVAATAARWSDDNDIVEAIEAAAATIVFTTAEARGELDRVEEEIFLFARAVEANPELQMALTNPAATSEAKSALVADLVSARAAEGSAQLLSHVAANLRGRRADVALRQLSEIAAAKRDRIVAEVRVAIALTPDQSQRLAAVLGRLAGRNVSLNVVVDPSVIGGVSVRLGDDVIDGSIRTRLDQARRILVG